MDLRRLARLVPQFPQDLNHTSTGPPDLTHLPPNILDALIPGYSLISRSLSAYLGLDVSVFVSLGVLFFAVSKGGSYIRSWLEKAFSAVFMSSVFIDEHDDLFDMVMAWLAANQTASSRTRQMRAKTQRGSRAEDASLDDGGAEEALDENGMFNYVKWSARTPPRFEPYYGRQFVWHKGHVLWFRRSRRTNEGQRVTVSFNNAQDDDILQLDCIGRTIEPIKDFLRTVKIWSSNRTSGFTTIRHPTPKDRARFSGTWSKTSSRPSRPMDTVILDQEQKAMIIRDMNEYLHPSSPRWYSTRGIPYRRGYLFHGPPGTGKTSLSFALAGIFGLEIYVVSLQEPSLTEGDLMQLFNSLPRRCIVLLEDVDAAGLTRDGSSEAPESKSEKESKKEVGKSNAGSKKEETATLAKKDDEFTLKDLAKELKAITATRPGRRGGGGGGGGFGALAAGANAGQDGGQGMSLSGLLNAIDGVATHEGRVLIMTTNHPERLDPALVRPGRVDRKVEFRLAMKEQVRELFVRMYTPSEDYVTTQATANGALANGMAKARISLASAKGTANGHAITPVDDALAGITRAELEELAVEFASHVPDNTFTPAEVQNLLMRHKKEPRRALAKVQAWIEETLAEKEGESYKGGEERDLKGDA